MTPYYVVHKVGEEKSGKKRKTDSYIFYYICSKHHKEATRCDHSNRISASKTEKWVLNIVPELLSNEALMKEVIENAQEKSHADLTPTWRILCGS
ncbi:hypothetical protein IAD21_04256 [Abditibacteriota bacterium]|nr:hypothetical protein IAD21_04256 [Abditibacteriota bacterium]